MASRGSALARDPELLREDEAICERVAQDLQRCARHCRQEADAARDDNFSRALLAVAHSCEEGILALECHLDSLEEGAATQSKGCPVPPAPQPFPEGSAPEDGWRPGANTPLAD